MTTQSEFAIIGGGVAGLSLAIGFENINKDYLVFEQAKQLKGIGAGFGMAANAMQAFDYLGLREEVEKIGFYTTTFNILDHKGETLVAPDTKTLSSRYNQKNFTVHRADLHLFLCSKIPQDKLVLNKKVLRYEEKGESIIVYFNDGSTHQCTYLIVADGVKSAIRKQLIPTSQPRYSGYTCWRATIDNTDVNLKAGSETWGKEGRFGMTPLVGNRVYWYACINSEANSTIFKNYTIDDLQVHFANYHDPIPYILANTKNEDLIWNDIVDVKPLSKFAYNRILLIGDAAHATTPNLGQGACQALEDVAVLIDELKMSQNVLQSFISFEKRRLARTKYITDTSWKIGKVAQWDNRFLIALRNTLCRLMPAKWSQNSLKKLLKTDFMSINISR